jgi:hypothetical protein
MNYSSFTFVEQLPMGGEQLPRASKYQRVGSWLLLLRANPYFRALLSTNADRMLIERADIDRPMY